MSIRSGSRNEACSSRKARFISTRPSRCDCSDSILYPYSMAAKCCQAYSHHQKKQASQRNSELPHFPTAIGIFHLRQPRVVNLFGKVNFGRAGPAGCCAGDRSFFTLRDPRPLLPFMPLRRDWIRIAPFALRYRVPDCKFSSSAWVCDCTLCSAALHVFIRSLIMVPCTLSLSSAVFVSFPD